MVTVIIAKPQEAALIAKMHGKHAAHACFDQGTDEGVVCKVFQPPVKHEAARTLPGI